MSAQKFSVVEAAKTLNVKFESKHERKALNLVEKIHTALREDNNNNLDNLLIKFGTVCDTLKLTSNRTPANNHEADFFKALTAKLVKDIDDSHKILLAKKIIMIDSRNQTEFLRTPSISLWIMRDLLGQDPTDQSNSQPEIKTIPKWLVESIKNLKNYEKGNREFFKDSGNSLTTSFKRRFGVNEEELRKATKEIFDSSTTTSSNDEKFDGDVANIPDLIEKYETALKEKRDTKKGAAQTKDDMETDLHTSTKLINDDVTEEEPNSFQKWYNSMSNPNSNFMTFFKAGKAIVHETFKYGVLAGIATIGEEIISSCKKSGK